jgi:hypothetical protein
MQVRAGAGDAAAVPLQWSEAAAPAGAPAGTGCRLFELPEPLQATASITLGAQVVFTHVLRPEPAERRMSEPQRVVYRDAAQLTSPYKVEKQATEVGGVGWVDEQVAGMLAGCDTAHITYAILVAPSSILTPDSLR